MLSVRILIILLLLSANCFSKAITFAEVKYRVLKVREIPSKRGKVIGKLKRGTVVKILNKKGKWFKILPLKNDNSTIGWVYRYGLWKFKHESLPDYKVKIEFNNMSKNFKERIFEFKKYLNFDFYKNDVKIIFSYDKTLNKLTLFIETKFSKIYYDKNREKALKTDEIDLYPYLNFAYVIDRFIKAVKSKYPGCGEFLQKFSIDIILKKDESNFIILDLYRKRKIYKFSPFIIIKSPDYKIIKIYCENPEKLEKSYIFELPPPYLSNGIKTTAYLIYNFFKKYWSFKINLIKIYNWFTGGNYDNTG